jgi:hypothetical protein
MGRKTVTCRVDEEEHERWVSRVENDVRVDTISQLIRLGVTEYLNDSESQETTDVSTESSGSQPSNGENGTVEAELSGEVLDRLTRIENNIESVESTVESIERQAASDTPKHTVSLRTALHGMLPRHDTDRISFDSASQIGESVERLASKVFLPQEPVIMELDYLSDNADVQVVRTDSGRMYAWREK